MQKGARVLQWGIGADGAALAGLILAGQPALHVALDPDENVIVGLLRAVAPDPVFHARAPLVVQNDAASPSCASYDLYPIKLGMKFDLIVIDANRRVECVFHAWACLEPNGLLIIRDLPKRLQVMLEPTLELVADGPWQVFRRQSCLPLVQTQPKRRRAIFVQVMGHIAHAEYAITRPSIEAYAESVGATLVAVHVPPGTPLTALKTEFLSQADGFDDFLLLDGDLLIRPHCPDLFELVPDGILGAFHEGRSVPRGDGDFDDSPRYGLPAVTSSEYFNSGVLAFSRSVLPLFTALRAGPVFGSILMEQNFLNLWRRELHIGTMDLGCEFNFLIGYNNWLDWRSCWIIHMAGARKLDVRNTEMWTLANFVGGQHWNKQPLAPRALRRWKLQELAWHLAGRDLMVFDAGDMQYFPARGRIAANGIEQAVIWVDDGSANGMKPDIAVFGPFKPLGPGLWEISLLEVGCPDGECLPVLDIVHSNPVCFLRERGTLEAESCRIALSEEVRDLQIRFYNAGKPVAIGAILVERINSSVKAGSED